MEKQIANVRYQMIGTVAFVFILSGWQYGFVYKGFVSNPYMIGAILVGFLFSCVMAFIFISKLKNEVIAFHALKEMWDDIRMGPKESEKDPLWRHHRCSAPGRVFHRPRILGHAYDLVTDELARTKKIRVSIETMNTLVHKVEQSIADERSLLVYMSGLLVFMGLIGTFIGLLKMVGSIGGILGALQTTGGGGSAADAFQKLLSDLQAPLAGMTTGFAASLFGLFGSLIVGLLARFAGQAAGVLKREFEAWLAGVVQIGEDEYKEHPGAVSANGQAVTVGAPDSSAMMRLLGGVLGDYARVANSFDHAARLLADMRAAQEVQSGVTERLVGELARIQTTQTRLLEEIGEIAPIAPALRDLGTGLESFGTTVSRRIEVDVAGLREMIGEMDRAHASTMRMLSTNQLQATTQMAGAIEQLSSDIDRRMAAPSTAMLEATLERSVRTGLGEVGRVMASHTDRLETRSAKLAEKQDRIIDELARVSAERRTDGDFEKFGQSLETALTDGFGRVSQTMETAFSAYSSLLHVAVAAVERTGASNAPVGEAAARPAEAPQDAASHFERESEELERLLDDFRMRAAAGRSL